MPFSELIGRQQVKARLGSALLGDPGHAYLFTGPAGIGKMRVARLFAKALLCKHPTAAGACDSCDACRLFDNGVHPDFRKAEDPAGKQIKVDQLRSDIVGDVNMLPQYGDRKVYLLDGDLLNEQGQNILLKTLEEPPVYAYILITAAGPEKLVGTMISRMVHIPLPLCTQDEIREILATSGVSPDLPAVPFLVRYARGVPGVALDLSSDSWYVEIRNALLDKIQTLGDASRVELLTEIFPLINSEKDHVDDLLDIIESWIRDLALAASGADERLFLNADRVSAILDQSGQTRYDIEQLERAAVAVQRARRGLAANTNFEMTVCSLLLQLRKELSHV